VIALRKIWAGEEITVSHAKNVFGKSIVVVFARLANPSLRACQNKLSVINYCL
jgi:hypothetical protein